ncbi:hypothetical protein QZH41_007343 [Actinostola sp. cb2023]|nr:hypothetical protein QZH41_007343 [Actinostola sp. cb2023]
MWPLTGGVRLRDVSAYGRCTPTGGVRLREVSACGMCPLTGGVRIREVSIYGRCPLTGGACLREVSAYGRCPLTGGVRLREVSAYGRCPLTGGVRLREVSAYGRCPLTGGVRLREVSAYGRTGERGRTAELPDPLKATFMASIPKIKSPKTRSGQVNKKQKAIGPNLMQDLTGILIKFRNHRVAFTADIEKAFLQIELNHDDRDATRFLWFKDINKSANNTSNLQAYRFWHVLFGATPSPFLLNDQNITEREIDPDYIPSENSAKEVTKRAKYHDAVIRAFWSRRQQEYLTGLREHHSTQRRASYETTVGKGDVVLIHDSTPRNQWKTGVVTKLQPGKDRRVRSVSLRVSSGRELSRPIEKLYPLEMQVESSGDNSIKNTEEHTERRVLDRPIRLAAQKALQRIKEQSE